MLHMVLCKTIRQIFCSSVHDAVHTGRCLKEFERMYKSVAAANYNKSNAGGEWYCTSGIACQLGWR